MDIHLKLYGMVVSGLLSGFVLFAIADFILEMV